MKAGDKAKASPKITGETEWVEGEVIDVEQNPFQSTINTITNALNISKKYCTAVSNMPM